MAAIGIAYVVVLALGMARVGLARPITDPILAIMEVLTLLSAPAILASLVALRECASPDRNAWATLSVAFATIFTGLTSAVHFVELTAVRQAGGGGIAWPSPSYALELLAWDWFLGLALLAAAPVFDSTDRAQRLLRTGFGIAGALCVAGTIGPAIGDMRLQRIGIVGYAIALPVVFYALLRHFLRGDAERAERRGIAAARP